MRSALPEQQHVGGPRCDGDDPADEALSAATTVRSTSTPSRDPASMVTRSGPAGPEAPTATTRAGTRRAPASAGCSRMPARAVQGRDLALRRGEAGGQGRLLGARGGDLVVAGPDEALERAEDGGRGGAHRLEPGGPGHPERPRRGR